MQRDSDRIPKNVLGRPLQTCSERPLTGFFRDGCCNTNDEDVGAHVICVRVTREFLEFSAAHGNDLSRPLPSSLYRPAPGDAGACARRAG